MTRDGNIREKDCQQYPAKSDKENNSTNNVANISCQIDNGLPLANDISGYFQIEIYYVILNNTELSLSVACFSHIAKLLNVIM